MGRRSKSHAERAIFSAMARPRKAEDRDVISRLADAGEDALRRLLSIPRRIVEGTRDDVRDRLSDAASKLRKIDPLDSRVTAVEKRLDSLEKPAKTSARAAPTRARVAEPAQAPDEQPAKDAQ